jgi:DNA invertase Pin-like site-specific DNA recombinase
LSTIVEILLPRPGNLQNFDDRGNHHVIGSRIRERTMAGLQASRARGRKGGRKFTLSKSQVRLAQAAMANRDTSVSDLCVELGMKPVTLYRYVDPKGNLRDYGKRVLEH